MTVSARAVKKFQNKVYQHYQAHGRNLPWRATTNPYHILVSEVMLQQTQVDRVIPKYQTFIRTFPTIKKLASSSRAQVIKQWQGLGYNRRALHLHQAAQRIVTHYHNRIPTTPDRLQTLSGIGPYTANAIAAFAFNQPVIVIETNIRTVFIHHFFPHKKSVTDQEIMPLINQTLDRRNPANWYQALMDYGAMLKKIHPNPSRRSKHHTIQSKFIGSNRQIRGHVIKLLTDHAALSKNRLIQKINRDKQKTKYVISQLEEEGFILKKGLRYSLKD